MGNLTEEIPVIDFTPYNLDVEEGQVSAEDDHIRDLAAEIMKAFTTIGFVYIKNHGLGSDDVTSVRDVVDRFFQLPVSVKQQYTYKQRELQHGWVGVEMERLEPDKPGDLKECYNVTPQCADVWPEKEISGFREATLSFYRKCDDLARRILQIITIGLGIEDKEFFTKHHNAGKNPNRTTLRFLHYPAVKTEMKPGQSRLGEHTDYGSITLLFQDDVGGLEVKRPDGTWIPADPIPGTVLVNIADVMQRWTADKLVSTPHRVYAKLSKDGTSKTRRSMAFFVHADEDTIIECIDGSDKYASIRDVDYLTYRCSNTYI